MLLAENGNVFLASAFDQSSSEVVSLLGTEQTDTTYMTGPFRNSSYPTLADFNDTSVMLCAEHPTLGVSRTALDYWQSNSNDNVVNAGWFLNLSTEKYDILLILGLFLI